jgi:hypothetical protein
VGTATAQHWWCRSWSVQTRARRRSCGGKFLREMWECGGRIEDATKMFDEILAAGKVKPSLRSGSGPRAYAARGCADAMQRARSKRWTGNRRRRRSCAGQRRAVTRRARRWCAGKSRAVREVLQRDDSGRTRLGGSRVARGGRRKPLRRRQRKARP